MSTTVKQLNDNKADYIYIKYFKVSENVRPDRFNYVYYIFI